MPNVYRWLCPACKSPDATTTLLRTCVAEQHGRWETTPGTAYEVSDRPLWRTEYEIVLDESTLHDPRYECSCGVLYNQPSLCLQMEDGTWAVEIDGTAHRDRPLGAIARRD